MTDLPDSTTVTFEGVAKSDPVAAMGERVIAAGGMYQLAGYPEALANLVARCKYKPGWTVKLVTMDRGQGSTGLTLSIVAATVNSYDHEAPKRVNHLFPVPPAAYDERSWRRWLLEQFLLVEQHEACEFFEIDGAKPYAPSHGPGSDPYLIREIGTELDQRTSFRGKVNE